MSKYTVKHTSVMHNKKVYSEGSEIELTEDQAKRLADFIVPVPEEILSDKPKTQAQSTKTKAKTEKTTKKIEPEAENSDEGAKNDEQSL